MGSKLPAAICLTYLFGLAIVLAPSVTIGWGPLFGLGLYLGMYTWWGWPFRTIAIDHPMAFGVSAVLTPLATSLVLGLLLERLKLGGLLSLYASTLAYYLAGSLWYYLNPGLAPDVDIAVALGIWLAVLAGSVALAYRALGLGGRRRRGGTRDPPRYADLIPSGENSA